MIRSRLPSFVYEESDILNAVIDAIQAEIDAYKAYKEQRVLALYLETSSESDLDRIGLLVGEPRKGRSDEEYRAAILAKVTSTAGTKQVLLNIARSLTDETADVKDHSPGIVEVDINAERFGNTPQDSVREAIRKAKVAGVHPLFTWKVFESTRDEVEVSEDVSFPKRRLEDLISVIENAVLKEPLRESESVTPLENVNIPLSASDAPYRASETVEKEESVSYLLHERPFLWDEAEWDFAEWE